MIRISSWERYQSQSTQHIMKTNVFSALVLVLLMSAGAYAQDSTGMTRRELRKQERMERKARVKSSMKETGRNLGDAATEVGRGAKETAKDAGDAINRGVDKAGNAIENEADKVKARREAKRAAKRDTL